MSSVAIPAASAVEANEPAVMPVDDLLAQIKLLGMADLSKVMKLAASQFEKMSKIAAKSVKTRKAATKKDGAPKRTDQLVKSRAWVKYVLEDATKNGWPAFPVNQSKTDKVTGVKTTEVIELPASVIVNDTHCFPDTNKPISHKQAMSLSSIYWVVKTKSGLRPDLYEAFDAQFVAPAVDAVADEKSDEEEKPVVVRKTASQKAREKDAEKAAKDAEKAAKKAAKDAEKAAKDAEKAAKKAEKDAKPAAKKADAKPADAKPAAKKVVPKKVAAPAEEDWVAPDEEDYHQWTYKGVKYWRNYQGRIFAFKGVDVAVDAEDWIGLWDPVNKVIDLNAELPEDD